MVPIFFYLCVELAFEKIYREQKLINTKYAGLNNEIGTYIP